MVYDLTVIEPTGFVTSKEYNDNDYFSRIYPLRKVAHYRAVKCLPWSQYDKKFTHLVYYYELKHKDNIEVRIEMNPRLVDDDTFYKFVDDFKPMNVGAIHRH